MDPNADPAPAIFVTDLQDANKKLILLKVDPDSDPDPQLVQALMILYVGGKTSPLRK
jgi:hypothetical protein